MYNDFIVKNGWVGKKRGCVLYLYNVAAKEFAVFKSKESFDALSDTVLSPVTAKPDPDFAGNPHFTAITLTTKCNMECPYCYVKPVSGNGVMSPELARSAVKALAAQTDEDLVIFAWGGEPTQNPDALLAMIEEASNYPYIKVLLISNGVMNDELLQRLLKFENLVFQISFDGLSNENRQKPLIAKGDSLGGMLDSMDTISQVSKRVSLRATATRSNIEELRRCLVPTAKKFTNRIILEHMHTSSGRAVNLKHEAPAVEDYANIIFDLVPAAEADGIHIKVLPLDQLREGGPNDTMNFLNILTDGSITVSNAIIHSSHKDFDTLNIGYIENDKIVFNQEKNQLLCQRYTDNYHTECEDCFVQPICRGSVQRYAFITHDPEASPNPQCDELRCQYYKSVIARWIDTLIGDVADFMRELDVDEGIVTLLPPAEKIHYPMFIMKEGLALSHRMFNNE